MPFTADQKIKFREAFNFFDDDKSGQISESELSNVMQKLGYSLNQAQIQTIMNHIDTDHSGSISFEEFLTFIEKAQK